VNNTVTAAIGSSALTFPFWSLFLAHGWSVLIAVLGLLVLITTLWKNVLDVRIKRKQKALLEIEMENLK
jgi:hypothetical protein